jgi:predicted nucleotidyltransferase
MLKHCLNMNREIIKPIVKMGNSACVLLPKAWIDGKAKVELVEEPFDVRRNLFEILNPYLEDIIGIYIVGSYARGEQTDKSDVDVLVITNNASKRIEKGRYEIILIPKNSVESQLKKNILPLLPMLKEAKPLMNAKLIEPYKNTRLTKRNLEFHIETTKSAMKVIEKSIDLAKEMGIDEGDGSAYSLILRLRGIYFVDCLRKNKIWNKNDFLRLIRKISGSLTAYEGYLRVKADEGGKDRLPIEEAQKLHDYVVKKIKEQENWIKKKKNETQKKD